MANTPLAFSYAYEQPLHESIYKCTRALSVLGLTGWYYYADDSVGHRNGSSDKSEIVSVIKSENTCRDPLKTHLFNTTPFF